MATTHTPASGWTLTADPVAQRVTLRGPRPEDYACAGPDAPDLNGRTLYALGQAMAAAVPAAPQPDPAVKDSLTTPGAGSTAEESSVVASAVPAAPQVAAAPAGYKLVPVEPTPEMMAAIPWPINVTPNLAVNCWRDMLAAAPEVAAPQGLVTEEPEEWTKVWIVERPEVRQVLWTSIWGDHREAFRDRRLYSSKEAADQFADRAAQAACKEGGAA